MQHCFLIPNHILRYWIECPTTASDTNTHTRIWHCTPVKAWGFCQGGVIESATAPGCSPLWPAALLGYTLWGIPCQQMSALPQPAEKHNSSSKTAFHKRLRHRQTFGTCLAKIFSSQNTRNSSIVSITYSPQTVPSDALSFQIKCFNCCRS